MLGAVVGDIVGSRFEFSCQRNKNFDLFTENNFFTDDTVMTCAVAKALLDCNDDFSNLSYQAIKSMQKLGRKYDGRGYGSLFLNWLYVNDPRPYKSYGNGSAMRISPVAYVAKSIDEVKSLSAKVTVVTHNHPEGMKGAEAVAVAIWLALHGKTKEEIKKHIVENYYAIQDNYDKLPVSFYFDATCPGTIPQSLYAFFNSDSFEDAIRIAVSFGGDTDTMAAIAGSIAGAYYGIPADITKKAKKYLDRYLNGILNSFSAKYIK